MSEVRPIIVKKKKVIAGGAHGGAWKVAYADFVTAMMAFFLLLWLVSTASQDTLKGISEYFMPVEGLKGAKGVGLNGGKANVREDGFTGDAAKIKKEDDPATINVVEETDNDKFENVANSIRDAFRNSKELSSFIDNVIIEMTPEGLRIQIVDDHDRPMFKPGTDTLQPYMKQILLMLGAYIKDMPNYIAISGHTNRQHQGGLSNEEKWILSSSRSNKVRAFLTEEVMKEDQIYRVAGLADREPIKDTLPDAIRNIRISILILKSSIAGRWNSLPAKEE